MAQVTCAADSPFYDGGFGVDTISFNFIEVISCQNLYCLSCCYSACGACVRDLLSSICFFLASFLFPKCVFLKYEIPILIFHFGVEERILV